ncbi:MAG: sulfite exporter TauE/SafE family protein, partial [Thermoplasmatales archaeon]|nr:sulfite exporter TauE/SafE family protein [Thermoplasmatales archaeon]
SSGAVTLILIFILGYNLHTAIGTSLLMMFFITGSGAIGHGFIGNFIFDVALIAGMGAVIGAASGSLIANRFDENKLGRLIGAILTIIGVIFMIKLFI